MTVMTLMMRVMPLWAPQVVFLHPKDNDGVLMELEEVKGTQT
jgi:hypothetical protein